MLGALADFLLMFCIMKNLIKEIQLSFQWWEEIWKLTDEMM